MAGAVNDGDYVWITEQCEEPVFEIGKREKRIRNGQDQGNSKEE